MNTSELKMVRELSAIELDQVSGGDGGGKGKPPPPPPPCQQVIFGQRMVITICHP
jgi:hypothetical protein